MGRDVCRRRRRRGGGPSAVRHHGRHLARRTCATLNLSETTGLSRASGSFTPPCFAIAALPPAEGTGGTSDNRGEGAGSGAGPQTLHLGRPMPGHCGKRSRPSPPNSRLIAVSQADSDGRSLSKAHPTTNGVRTGGSKPLPEPQAPQRACRVPVEARGGRQPQASRHFLQPPAVGARRPPAAACHSREHPISDFRTHFPPLCRRAETRRRSARRRARLPRKRG